MNRETVTVYEPNYRAKIGFFKVWLIMFKNIIASKELIYQLFQRDFLMSYKKSFIGMGWIFISPVIGIISWVFMNYTGVLNPGDVGIPYPAYILLSTSIWGLFMGFYSSAAGTLGAGSGFIMQVKYPHEALLIKQTAQHLVNFFITFVVTIVVLIIFKVFPSWKIVMFPLLIIPLFLLGAGIGLLVSVIGVVATDLQKGFDFILGMILYITPVIYSPKVNNPLLQEIIKWNPLTYLIGGVRDIIIYGKMEYLDRFFYALVLSLLIFLLSLRLFFISEDKVIEKMI
jgi:ABC-type polysaccharide/polyol phosphate export systems, permease component